MIFCFWSLGVSVASASVPASAVCFMEVEGFFFFNSVYRLCCSLCLVSPSGGKMAVADSLGLHDIYLLV